MPSLANVENEVRTTPEYAAVFALEKWRASQLKKWNEEWLEEKKKRIRDLELSFSDRAEDLDNKAGALESLGEKLRHGFQALEAQKKDQERREQAFAASQLHSASEHESSLQTVQERSRRLVMEVQAKLDNERTKNRELEQLMAEQNNQKKMQESTNSKLNEKLLEVQKKDAEHAAALADKDKDVFDLRKQLAESREKSATLQRELSEAQSRVFKLEENAQFYRSEAKRVVSHHNKLLEEIFKEREQKLKQERENLEYYNMTGRSPNNNNNGAGKSATFNCIEAALKKRRQELGEDEEEVDDECEKVDQQQQQVDENGESKKKVSTTKKKSPTGYSASSSAGGIHTELRSMADMIEQLARSIDHAEERERKRDEETAKTVSNAVRESMMESFSQHQQEEEDDDSEMIYLEDEGEDENNHVINKNNNSIKGLQQSFDPVSGTFKAKFGATSDNNNKYVGHRYLQSPEFYELRPQGFHSSGKKHSNKLGVFSSIDSNNSNNIEMGLNESAATQEETRDNSNNQDQDMKGFDQTKTFVDHDEHTTSNNMTGKTTTMSEEQRREETASRARESALLKRQEYYSSSERIPSSTIRTSSSRARPQDIDENDDSVRLEGDDTAASLNIGEDEQQHQNNSGTKQQNTTVLSSLSIPESENLNQFDDDSAMLDFGPHGEKITPGRKATQIHQGDYNRQARKNNNNNNNKAGSKVSASPPSSISAETNLQMNNSNNNKPKRQASAVSSSNFSNIAADVISRNSPAPSVPVVDSEGFLIRLERSRERLLETGVYKASDRIIVDMDRQIAEYKKKRKEQQ